MKVAICYGGYLGTTEEMACYIRGRLEEDEIEVELINLFQVGKINYLMYDEIILGSCIHVGKPTSSFLKCIKKLNKLGKEFYIYYMASKHSQDILDYLTNKAGEFCRGIYFGGGEFRPELAKGFSKMVTNAAISNLQFEHKELPKIEYEEIDEMIKKIKEKNKNEPEAR